MKTGVLKNTLIHTAVLAALMLTACEDQKTESRNQPQGQVRVNATDKMSADELVHSAEQLVSPYTFMLAYKMAKLAYEKDPTNLKAEFYMKLLKRFEAFRGIFSRIRPVLNQEQIAQHEKWIQEFPISPMRDFLTEKGKPIHNVTDMQDVLSEYYAAIREFRDFLKKNQTADLKLNMNPHVFEEEIKREMMNNCQVVETPVEGGINITVECNHAEVATKRLNTADLIWLRQIISGELIYSMYNSYSLEGIEKLDQQTSEMTNAQKAQFLSSLPKFGLLRRDHAFGVIKDIGSDLSAAIKWAVKYQKDLCPKGYETENQRRGFLFGKGICLSSEDTELNQFLAVLDRALGGVATINVETPNEEGRPMNLNLFAWATRPVQDLRQIAPINWNECDKATSLKDNTLGGIFVDNDFQLTMDTSCE